MKPQVRAPRSEAEKASLRGRHARLLGALPEHAIAIIVGGGPAASYNTGRRSDQDAAYLTGLDEPDLAAVFWRGAGGNRALLFKRERDRHYELWNGPMMSLAEAADQLGFDSVCDMAQLESELVALLTGCTTIFFETRGDPMTVGRVQRALDAARVRRHGAEIRETWGLMAELRMVKDDFEIGLLERSARATSDGHSWAMARTVPGMTEAQLQGELEAAFKRGGATGLGYQSIVAAGSNACCLHYTLNCCVIDSGDLVLIDAGASYGGYTADVTRTFPATGKFSPEQALIYDIVLDTQLACLAAVKPGASHHELQNLAVQRLCKGLELAGLLDQSAESCIASGDYKRFYGHSLGHWLGRDVHDSGPSLRGVQPRAFEPGHVLTVEPGLYFQPYDERIPEAFRGMGIRIEDDVLVTQDGSRVLTDAVKSRQDIEDHMSHHRKT